MNYKEIQETIERYNKRLEKFGVTEKALGWGKKGRAKLRYEILLSLWDFHNQSILDFGCGFGDLYKHILEKNFKNVRYTGIDINPNLIREAKKKHPSKIKFLTKNILTTPHDERYDFILSSGVFNYKLKDNRGFIKKSFKKFNSLSKKGFAVNFLSHRVTYKQDYHYYANPAFILELAFEYSSNVVLRHDYMPFEFTIFINKFSEIDKKYTVYKEYLKYV